MVFMACLHYVQVTKAHLLRRMILIKKVGVSKHFYIRFLSFKGFSLLFQGYSKSGPVIEWRPKEQKVEDKFF